MSTHQTRQVEKARVIDFSPPKSNTGGGNHKPLDRVSVGPDWLGLTVYGANVVGAVRDELAACRAAAESGQETYFTLGGLPWQVMPYGFGKGASHMAYVLRGNGLVLAISKRDKSPVEGGGPVAMLTAPGTYCCGRTIESLAADLTTAIEMCGFTASRIGVNRADIAVDQTRWSVSDAYDVLRSGRVVCRSRDHEVTLKGKMTGEVETFYVGSRKSDTFLCVYNKSLELSGNALKAEAYKAGHGLESVPELLTRYEWRLTGDCLREQHNVTTLAEFVSRFRSIVEYLVKDWYRECETVDRENQQRSVVRQGWLDLGEAVIDQLNDGDERHRRPVTLPVAEKLIDQLKGCVATVMASMSCLPDDACEAVLLIQNQMKAGAEEWRSKVMKRAAKYRTIVADMMFNGRERLSSEAFEAANRELSQRPVTC